MTFSPEQTARAVEVMQEYLHAPPTTNGKTPSERSADGDKERVELIDGQLKQMVEAYIAGTLSLDEFKPKIYGINKRHENWGFKGINGQMFFYMVVNVRRRYASSSSVCRLCMSRKQSWSLSAARPSRLTQWPERLATKSPSYASIVRP